MELIKARQRGYCLIASFAMCLETSIEELISEIGHNGLAIRFPQYEEPFSLRGFHQQELIDCAFARQIAVTQIDAIWVVNDGEQVVELDSPNRSHQIHRFYQYIKNCNPGIILGETIDGVPHAVASDGSNIFDPNGFIYPLADCVTNKFTNFEAFLRFDKISD